MLPNTPESHGRRASSMPEIGFDSGRDTARNELAAYVRRGRHLRAEALARFGRRIGTAVWRAARRFVQVVSGQSADADDELSVIADRLRSPLTSIRSSAEILRDHADIDPAERQRFLSIVLAEEARMEALVSAMLDGSSVERRRGVWRVPLKHLDPRREERAHCAP